MATALRGHECGRHLHRGVTCSGRFHSNFFNKVRNQTEHSRPIMATQGRGHGAQG
ncbi:hypothetical protein DSM3645_04013 [Blastopirellula marina DSM 3645]|uniref:Uncharacterized protein n=1 Tax=Blastopirellula marina DSM 3645 TaxID=314230 RepID=A3ZV46_9BACT|nr:hypothetical protein DSM3645_04013 [Blastopirellula marina DSM 3645]